MKTWTGWLCAGALLLSGAQAALAQNFNTTRTPAPTGEADLITWGLGKEPSNLDPVRSNDYFINEVLVNACDDLFRLDPDFSVSNGLAVSKSQPDPTTIVYGIRPGVVFWDGKPLTAEDVAYSLSRNLDPAAKSSWTRYYNSVLAIEATGPLEVTVKLKRPDVLFNAAMATAAGAVVQKAQAEANHGVIGTPQVMPMCTGPFKLVHWTPGTSIELARNEQYWDPGHRPRPNPSPSASWVIPMRRSMAC